jgi:hypothetical protein
MAEPLIWQWIMKWPTGISFFFWLHVAIDIPGKPSTRSHTDTQAAGASPLFYRV